MIVVASYIDYSTLLTHKRARMKGSVAQSASLPMCQEGWHYRGGASGNMKPLSPPTVYMTRLSLLI